MKHIKKKGYKLQHSSKIIIDELRNSYFKKIYKRIYDGKSSLITGKTGSGKTVFLESIHPEKIKILSVESLGSLNHILCSILKKQQYRFSIKKNKSADYLEAVCKFKKIVITIDDVDDLRSGIFRYIKRIIDSQIPVIMAGNPEMQVNLREKHEDVYCRLKIFHLESIGFDDIKKQYPQFEKDTLEVIFGFSAGNMWIFREICEECLDEMKQLKLDKVKMNRVQIVYSQKNC